RQQTTLKNDVASSQSLVWRFCHRRLTASPNVAVACPVAVNRSSGSRVMLPTRVTLFPFAISLRSVPSRTRAHGSVPGRGPLAADRRIGEADHLVADHLVGEAERPVELGHHRGLRLGLDDHVVALPAVPELVGEPTLAPAVDPTGDATPRADQLGGAVDGRPDRILLQAGIEDDPALVRPHGPPLTSL